MNPHIATPRQHGAVNFGSTSLGGSGRQEGLRMPRFFKRLFKFPQMDFEMAIWEMWSLLVAPKKVWRSVYYNHQTKNTWHRPDPSFTYLLSFFMALTGIAWGVAYADSAAGTLRLMLIYVFVHFLAVSLLVATAAYFVVGRFLGQGIPGLPGRRRQQGLFVAPQNRSTLEFGYCFDVSIRAFFPVWVLLYVVQYIMWPLIKKDYWISIFLGNTLYLAAFGYYSITSFLGYKALSFLPHTEFLMSPFVAFTVFYFFSLFGFNIAVNVAPILVLGSGAKR